MILSREEAIKATASTMEVIKTDMYYICRAEDGESERFTRNYIHNQKRLYEKQGLTFDIKEFAAGIMYNRLLNE